MAGNIFSLSLNEFQTKIVQLNYKKSKIELLSLGFENTVPNYFTNPNDKSAEQEAQIIRNLLNQLNISESKVQVVVPDSMTYSQLVVQPVLKEEELAQSIKLQVDEIIPLPLNEINLDFEIVSNLKDNKLLVLLVAIEKKLSDQIAKTLSFAKLEPVSLENELSVLGRFTAEVFPFTKEPALIVNLGFAATSFYIMNPPFPYFQFTRTIKLGYANFLKDSKVNLNITDEKAVELLKTVGLSNNGMVNIYPVIYPIIEEIAAEIIKVNTLAKERFGAAIKHIYFLNFDSQIAHLYEIIQKKVLLPVGPIPMNQILIPNPITQSFQNTISSFIPVIAANIR